MKKKILILGGIALSKEIVDQAHKIGLEVYVTDFLLNSPAKEIADKSFLVSATDIDAVVDLIQTEKIDGVLTGYIDLLLPYYVQICKKSGLPCYATEEQIAITTDKSSFKELCRKYTVPIVPEYSESDVIAGKAEFPVLVKPVDNSGARGVYICHDLYEFRLNYEKSLSFSQSKHVLIERYMSGMEATIFYFLHQGEVYLIGMGDRHMIRFDEDLIPLPVGYTFPSSSIEKFQKETNSHIIEMFKSIGLKEGMVFMQSFIEEGRCIIYEMGYRLTGSLEHHLINHAFGFNHLESIINFAVGNEIDGLLIKNLRPTEGFVANVTLLLKEGIINHYEGLEDVLNMEGVIHVFTSYRKGDIIEKKQMGTLAQVAVRVLLFAQNREELIERMEKIKRVIRVKNSCGENMIIDNYSYQTIIK